MKTELPKYNILSEDKYRSMTSKEFMDHIDEERKKTIVYFKIAGPILSQLEEVLIQWGKWSHNMNKILRDLIKGDYDTIDRFQYRVAYAYWWNSQHAVESYRKSFTGQIKLRKDIEVARGNLFWLHGIAPQKYDEIKNNPAVKMVHNTAEKTILENANNIITPKDAIVEE